MKILIVCGAGYISGKEIITLSLMEGLRGRGHEVRCVTSTWGDGEFVKRLEVARFSHVRIPLGFISKTLTPSAVRMTLHQILKLPRTWLGYRAYLRAFKPDLVVHSNFHHAFILWPLLGSRNTVYHVHDPIPLKPFYRKLFGFLNRRVAAFVGVSEYIRSMLVELGIPKEKAFSVLNGIDLPAPEADGERETAATTAGHGNSNGAVRIGIVGQVGAWKGHDDFVEALRELKEARLSFRGVIFGNGDEEYTASLRNKIAAYDLASEIRWAGFVANTRDIFAATDICVVPSRSQDPCPTVAIEAAHCGVPLIATKQGGLPELVRDGETGYLVDVCAPRQISEKLKCLVEDSDLRARFAGAARQHWRRNLTQARMVRQMETIFERLREKDRTH